MSEQSFDPGKHITKLKGNDYLEVKWRLVWVRSVHPNAVIETEMMHHDERLAVFRARVTLPDGGSATGWGSETPGDFRDYIEKAETKALGRALAALGFGTQFTGDDLSEGQRIVDAPVQRANAPQTRQDRSGATQPANTADDAPITGDALTKLSERATKAGITVEDLAALAQWGYGAEWLKDLTISQGREVYTTIDKANASELRELVRKARAALDAAPRQADMIPDKAGKARS